MSDASGFGKFVPGFEFLQNLAGQAAGGVVQGLGKSVPQMPNLGNWVAPTFNVEDLEKRIDELKAVQFWLDQNAKALAATIQALEVQKMTLATLKTMNFSLGDVANSLKLKATEAMAGFAGVAPAPAAPKGFAGLEIPPRTYGERTPEPEVEDNEEDADDEAPEEDAAPEPVKTPRKATAAAAGEPSALTGGVIDPLQWWGALSQQFQQIATTAMKDVAKQGALDATRNVASGLTEQAVKTATGMAGKAGRKIGDSVARNVGMAAGMGQAAVRAVSGKKAPTKAKAPAPAPAPKAKAKPQPAAKKKPVRRPAASPAPVAAQPLSTGDWPMPTAFFPGFMPAQKPAAAPAARKAAAKKKPAARR
ncbi:PhaM family polyhydroxyalkanoate granule multifunctional regulatory protein [Hydrogenophaga sp.]|uniref:PhaM family polyhydroxyalkanoate granule multifunctional regulatory protein n=1 Tax=Hydrogenophaga sp. TaxID=1904254 RepID=UPI0025BF29F6|nr:PhaM family polyhydroxyalkanoate granule multifunctional regulatory protein [Hydrogenophaga sp.]